MPFDCEQAFAVVADIERYPEFVPRYRASRILDRGDGTLTVEQAVAWGGLTFRFRSRAELEPPRAIHIHSADLPFRELAIHWLFQPAGTGCRVTFRMRYRLALPGLAVAAAPMVRGPVRETLAAFRNRVWHLYGVAGKG